MRKYSNLLKRCEKFLSLAIPYKPRSHDEMLDVFRQQVERTQKLMPNASKAQQIFKHIADIRNSGKPIGNVQEDLQNDQWYKELEKCKIQLEYFRDRVSPGSVGIIGVDPQTLPVLINNLDVLMAGKDFSQYKQVGLQANQTTNVNKEELVDQLNGKRDLGF